MGFDEYLLDIHNLIKIKDEDYQPYAHDYDAIRDHITNGLCRGNRVFKKLFKGTVLFGSTSNNVKINKLDERDVIVKFAPPFSEYIIAERSENCSAFVKLNFAYVLDELENSGDEELYDALYDMVDDDYYLVRGYFRRWVSILMKIFLKNNNVVQGYSGYWKLSYKPGGLAITIKAILKNRSKDMKIDFVPGFLLEQPEWIRNNNNNEWYACPKSSPNPDKRKSRLEFQIVNPLAERIRLLDRYNLKVVYRLLKAHRNKHNLNKIKSYFFTTIFLWKVNKERRTYWMKVPVSVIFLDMLEELIQVFEDGNLPYYWAKDHNLLSYFSDEELNEYESSLRASYNTLKTYPNQPNLTYGRCCDHFSIKND